MTSIQNDRTDETTVRRLLQQTSGAQPAEQSKDDGVMPSAEYDGDPATIIHEFDPSNPEGRLSHQPAAESHPDFLCLPPSCSAIVYSAPWWWWKARPFDPL
jgi:hypothetical protein